MLSRVGPTSLIFRIPWLIPGKGGLVFTIPIQAVKDNRTGRPHREVIVVGLTLQRGETTVAGGHRLVGDSPAGAEDDQMRAVVAGVAEGAVADRLGRGAGGGDDGERR